MDGIKLTVSRTDLVAALKVLGSHRRRRFVSVCPVWLSFDPATGELGLAEDRGTILATIAASGSWPPMGATVNLFSLRRVAERLRTPTIELAAIEDAIIVAMPKGHMRLDLIGFGTDGKVSVDEIPAAPIIRLTDLPLFRWAVERGL
ncbi:MAG: hypothetical protein AB7N54_15185 [Alphaproteobacteria bacterium]